MVLMPKMWWLSLVTTALLAACAGTTPAVDADAGSDTSGTPVTGKPVVNAQKAQFLTAFTPIVQQANDISLAQFLALHTPKDAVQPITPPNDPLLAKNLDLVDQKLTLTQGEKDKLHANGFVVSDRLQRETMAAALLEIFQKDLPVVVTTDAILQALHA